MKDSKGFKFGGKAMQTPAGAQQFVVGYISKETEFNKLVTISAFGKGTNALEYLYNQQCGIESHYLKPNDFYFDPHKYYEEYAESLCKDNMSIFNTAWVKVENILDDIKGTEEKDRIKLKAMLLAQGEIITVALISNELKNRGVKHVILDAQECIFADVVDDDFCNAKVNRAKTITCLEKKLAELEDYPVVLIPGFIARDDKGNTVNIKRDGSDHTMGLVARAKKLNDFTLCKDVLGVFPPDATRNGHPMSFISFNKVRGYVVNETGTLVSLDTITLCEDENMTINISYFGNPEKVGTVIGPEKKMC